MFGPEWRYVFVMPLFSLQLVLSLALFKTGILFINNVQLTFSANNFAVGASLFY
jgi:hypothetical protein